MQLCAESSSVPVPLTPSPHPLVFFHSPIGNPSKYVGPLRLVGEHAPRVYVYRITWCAGGYWHGNCVDSSQALVPTGNCIHRALPFLCGSCRVIGWLLRTSRTQPNIQGDVARPACVPAPPETPDTYFSVHQGRGLIRRGKETRKKASGIGNCRSSKWWVEGMGGPWWSRTVETNRSPIDTLFLSPLKYIMMKEVLVSQRKKVCCSSTRR